MTVTGHIEITYKRDDEYIYQTIRIIPNATKNLHYFIRDRYVLGRRVDDFLMDKYIGDGENILFIENNKFRNMNTIKYQILDRDAPVALVPKKYFIEGEIPSTDSCAYCKHMRPMGNGAKQIRCMLHKKFLSPKVHCIDFYEK